MRAKLSPLPLIACLASCALTPLRAEDTPAPEPLEDTAPLVAEGDLASEMIDGVDRFLRRQTEATAQRRRQRWQQECAHPQRFRETLSQRRKHLWQVLGVPPQQRWAASPELELRATVSHSAEIGSGSGFVVRAVRWPAFRDVHGEGVLLTPAPPLQYAGDVVVIPDADQTPEMLTGLAPGLPPESQLARRFAARGFRVLVPALVDRKIEKYHGVQLTHREYLYRPAFELGRHLVGYELAKVITGAQALAASTPATSRPIPDLAIWGYGEGGMLALYADALWPDDGPQLGAVCVSGFFGPREETWKEPVDRSLFGFLEGFGCAELAVMAAPRRLIVEACRGPEVEIPPGLGGAPGRLITPGVEAVRAEVQRARELLESLGEDADAIELVESGHGSGPAGCDEAYSAMLRVLGQAGESEPVAGDATARSSGDPQPLIDARRERQRREMEQHTQWLLSESLHVRHEFFPYTDTGRRQSLTEEEYRDATAEYRRIFYDEVIGRFDLELEPPHPRSRKAYDRPKWTGYEVVLDVFPDVFAYGVLLVPKDIGPDERRPVVVCQHGLEGRPQDTITGDHRSYHNYAARLAEEGFVVFAPQNPYIFGDRFRTLQRKANPLGKTLFSVIVPQHQQIVHWLQTLPFVDSQRIGFYGLSYGGKTAMRVPAIVTDYALSICSADFNDWVWKNAATHTRGRYSYVYTPEYEIFEFRLGETFNYAEMAGLICPRPLMVERGHFDGVAPDERVAYEFAKVRYLYAATLGLDDRCRIEWFVGPHMINSEGTFEFLREHLGPVR